MSMTVRAVYAGGVLRPVQPLPLAEGETVELTVTPTGQALRPPTPEEEAYARHVREARSLDELLAIVPTAPPLPDGYDLSRALNDNRKAGGERPLFPEGTEGTNP
jgi:predicted DNA-binding antitoxin AbrB/MazE fold protein